MNSLPKIRWAALIVVIAAGLQLAGVDGQWQASIAAGCLAVAKFLTELAKQVDPEDKTIYKLDGARPTSFWERVL